MPLAPPVTTATFPSRSCTAPLSRSAGEVSLRFVAMEGPNRLDEIDLTDLDRFADGFPHEVFTAFASERRSGGTSRPDTRPVTTASGCCRATTTSTAVAADHDTFSSEGGGARDGGGTLIEDLPRGFAAGVLLNMMDDPRHQRIRQLVTPAVSPRTLAAMEVELPRSHRPPSWPRPSMPRRCDFLVDVAAELPLQAIARLLGVPQADRHRLIGWANATLDYDDHDLGESTSSRRRGVGRDVRLRHVADRRQATMPGRRHDVGRRPRRDRTAGGHLEPLTDLELQMFFNLLIAAGSETTRNTIAVGAARPPRTSRAVGRARRRSIAAAVGHRGDPAVDVVDDVQPPHGHPSGRAPRSATSRPATR